MMSDELKHTPGPVLAFPDYNGNDHWLVGTRDKTFIIGRMPNGYVVNGEANSRLFAASYNAFDAAARRLKVNAVGLAGQMQDGGIADLLQALDDLHGDAPEVQGGICQHCGRDYIQDEYVGMSGDCPSDDCPAHIARVLIARVRGTV